MSWELPQAVTDFLLSMDAVPVSDDPPVEQQESGPEFPSRSPRSKCGIYALVRRRDVGGVPQFDLLRLPCKGWLCADCGPWKAARLRKAIGAKAVELGLTRFLTLPLDPARIPPDADPVKYLRSVVWAKLRTYLKRKYKKPIVYIAVLEFTKAGVPHLHLLVDRFIPQKWISACWDALGAGPIVWIERVYDVHRIQHYLTKYLTKDMILSVPPGVRRWSVSRGIKLFERRASTGEWSFLKRWFDILLWTARLRGYVVGEECNRHGEIQAFTVNCDPAAI